MSKSDCRTHILEQVMVDILLCVSSLLVGNQYKDKISGNGELGSAKMEQCGEWEEYSSICYKKYPMERKYWTSFLIISILIPLLITIFCYIGLVNQVKKVRKSVSTIGSRR